ncbi:protein phosphatase 1H-like [Watersipora subatra]|uniref:protein phosphatase 1H-like n=1 Tax=Watersipora subatra TaxID=2589382 RepID=UPI00355B0F43
MFKLLRDWSSGFTAVSETNAKNPTDKENNAGMGKGNKTSNQKNFKLKKKDVVEELLNLTTKYPYSRPTFMGLQSYDELQVALEHAERVIVLPKRSTLPRTAGYAECTNAGKSMFNEDQAAAIECTLAVADEQLPDPLLTSSDLIMALDQLTIFGVFDGHAGPDVAVTVSHELPHRIKERISSVLPELIMAMTDAREEDLSPQTINAPASFSAIKRKPTVDRLITGALETAFHDMDRNLVEDETQYTVKGGCATLVSLFYANKLYVANAGDCRAVMSLAGEAITMSTDFTPEYERRRLQSIAERHPDLLGNDFCPTQFTQRVTRKDVGTQMLYRDSMMEGWAYKTVTQEDLRFPMILGDGRRSRLLATIGLTRGLGDHNLKVFDSCIKVKPFLTCFPEVKIFDLVTHHQELSANDVLIMGTDGLWDVITNQEAVDMVNEVLKISPASDVTRYISAAQALVSYARGLLKADRKDVWLLKGTTSYASHDDISCYVIPLLAKPQDSVTVSESLNTSNDANSELSSTSNGEESSPSGSDAESANSQQTHDSTRAAGANVTSSSSPSVSPVRENISNNVGQLKAVDDSAQGEQEGDTQSIRLDSTSGEEDSETLKKQGLTVNEAEADNPVSTDL